MITTSNISTALQKLVSQGNPEYFADAFVLFSDLPDEMSADQMAIEIVNGLPAEISAEILSSFLTIEGGSEGEIEGVEFSESEIVDVCALFHEICERFPEVVRMAQGE